MPGLGWILKRSLYKEELEPRWPTPDKVPNIRHIRIKSFSLWTGEGAAFVAILCSATFASAARSKNA